jgi:hypothetical protein
MTMTEARSVAEDGAAMRWPAQPSTLPLLLHQGRAGFIALCCKRNGDPNQFQSRSYRVPELIRHLPPIADPGDWYISANTFKARRRSLPDLFSLRANFLDLDYYRESALSVLSPKDVWEIGQSRLSDRRIPGPQAAIFTGRGLQLVWAIGDLPPEAHSRWRAVQDHLAKVLSDLGADRNALDASRVLRLPGTLNSKSGQLAVFVFLDQDTRTNFEELAHAVLPVARSVLREQRQKRAAGRLSAELTRRSVSARSFTSSILSDLRRLVDHRWGGKIPEGWRNKVLFIYATFLVRSTGTAALPDALLAFSRKYSDLPPREVEQIARSLVQKFRSDGIGYRYSVGGICEVLGLSYEEARAAKLTHLMPQNAAVREARRQRKRERDKERQRRLRLTRGCRPRSGTADPPKPWLSLGMSRATWYRLGLHRRDRADEAETTPSLTIDGGLPADD